MAVIFVWYPKNGNVGHATMLLDDGGYVSWWPFGSVGGKVSTIDAASQGIANDRRAEGSAPDYASAPISKLDEAAMQKFWSGISGRMPRESHSTAQSIKKIQGGKYDLLKKSCAGMVLQTLIAGGMYKSYPFTVEMVANNIVTSPMMLKDLAEAMTGDTKNRILNFVLNSDLKTTTLRRVWQYMK